MKKAKRFLALFLVVCMMVCAMALPASAAVERDYSLSLPSGFTNAVRSTSLYTRGTGTAYVEPSVNTISTVYYLSPSRQSSTQATELVFTSNTSRRNFTFLSGYGGKDTPLCLSACPDWNVGTHDAYNVRGVWAQ